MEDAFSRDWSSDPDWESPSVALEEPETLPTMQRNRTIESRLTTDLSAWTDEELLARYLNDGDRRAFEDLFIRYRNELFSYLRHYLGDAEMAEDALQQTFLQVHLKSNTFDFERQKKRKFRPWLYTIATHQAIDLQRKNKRHRLASLDKPGHLPDGQTDDSCGNLGNLVLDDSLGDPLDGLITNEQSADVQRAVHTLPEPLRQVVLLVYYQGLKYREAADALTIPIGTVKSRLHTALGRIGGEVTAQFSDPADASVEE